MGRKRIEITKIANARKSQVTFAKRKHGLLKKAMELSLLCDCEVALLVVSKNGKGVKYSSHDFEAMVQKVKQAEGQESAASTIEEYTNKDYDSTFGRDSQAKTEGGLLNRLQAKEQGSPKESNSESTAPKRSPSKTSRSSSKQSDQRKGTSVPQSKQTSRLPLVKAPVPPPGDHAYLKPKVKKRKLEVQGTSSVKTPVRIGRSNNLNLASIDQASLAQGYAGQVFYGQPMLLQNPGMQSAVLQSQVPSGFQSNMLQGNIQFQDNVNTAQLPTSPIHRFQAGSRHSQPNNIAGNVLGHHQQMFHPSNTVLQSGFYPVTALPQFYPQLNKGKPSGDSHGNNDTRYTS